MTLKEYVLLFVQLTSYVAEVACCCFALWQLWGISRIWFALCSSLLIFFSVIVQVLSLCWTNRRVSCQNYAAILALHCLLLALPARYFLAGVRTFSTASNCLTVFKHTRLLRLVYVSICTLPLTICIFFVFWMQETKSWMLFGTCVVGVISSCVSLCILQRPGPAHNKKEQLACAEVLLTYIWRFGEITSRVLILVLFASQYTHWLFLVLALHWLTVICWSSISRCANNQRCTTVDTLQLLAVAYINIFVFLDLPKCQQKYQPIVYYLIMTIENATLLTVCLVYTWDQSMNVLIAMVATGAYLASLIAAGICHLCHSSGSRNKQDNPRETAAASQANKRTVQENGTLNSERQRPERPANKPPLDKTGSLTNSLETLNTQLSSFSSYVGPFYIPRDALPGMPLEASYFHSISDPDLSLKRSGHRRPGRSVSQVNKNDVIRLIMRESGSAPMGETEPTLSTLSNIRRPNGPHVAARLKEPNCEAASKDNNPMSESEYESEYAWDHYDFVQASPDKILQLDPKLLGAPIVFLRKATLDPSDPEHNESVDLGQSGQDSDYGTLNQWVASTEQVSRSNIHKRGVKKNRPHIVCGTGFHNPKKRFFYPKDALAWRRNGSEISWTSAPSSITTAFSAPSEMQLFSPARKGNNVPREEETPPDLSSRHSDPITITGEPMLGTTVLSSSTNCAFSSVGSKKATEASLVDEAPSAVSLPNSSMWSTQDDVCSLYSTDISSHTTTEELKAAISEKYRIKRPSTKTGVCSNQSKHASHSDDNHRVKTAVHAELNKLKKSRGKRPTSAELEAEIDPIVRAIQSHKTPETRKYRAHTDDSRFSQKSFTSDYGSLLEPENGLKAWYECSETET